MPRITKDPETGRIVASVLDPDEAREMAAARRTKAERAAEKAAELLHVVGFADPAEAPADLRLLAEKAAGDAAQSVGALRLFFQQTGRLVPTTKPAQPDEGPTGGDVCPFCGAGLPPEARGLLVAQARAYLERDAAPVMSGVRRADHGTNGGTGSDDGAD